MKVAEIVGARPQFIKAGVVSRALRAHSGTEDILIHTGQHYDDNMSQIFFEQLGIPHPDFNLGIGSLGHGAQTGRMLEALEKILLEIRPDWVLVYGDTNSTLAGALAASKLNIPVAHVEAGLRSFNRKMPEELNRIVADHLSQILFVPTDTALANLMREGIDLERIQLVGDVMYDAALHYAQLAEERSTILEDAQLLSTRYALATIHRAENTDDAGRLDAICDSLCKLSREIKVVFPVHPRTRKLLEERSRLRDIESSVVMMEPLGYLDMVMLEKHAQLIVTDSGGIQKEAFFHRVPCVTLRDETEWIELLDLGWNTLIPPVDSKVIFDGCLKALHSNNGISAQPYGDGRSATKIVEFLVSREVAA